ncbi:MAG: integration host factor subunit beta [Candidatus Sedimenticola sp. PURPLELP]
MTYDRDKVTQVSDRALEMIMRDVMDGLVEVSLESAFSDRICDFEIIEIEPRRHKTTSARTSQQNEDAEVIEFTRLKRASH